MRFFFDYRTRDQAIYDYGGDYFQNLQSAIEFAAAIAEDLKNSLTENWNGWSIEVRNAEGMKLSSISIEAAGSLAA
jgi:hypothetical protein